MQEEQSNTFFGFIRFSSTNGVKRGTPPSPQQVRLVLSVDDVKIYSTPRKLV